jgi:hypothetical protein
MPENPLAKRLPALIDEVYPGAFKGDPETLGRACSDLAEILRACLMFGLRTGDVDAFLDAFEVPVAPGRRH